MRGPLIASERLGGQSSAPQRRAFGKIYPDDDFETTNTEQAVTRAGDLWQLGRHRLFCGSAIEQGSFSQLLGDQRADVIFVDPPYNVEINGNVSGNGSIRHREFGMASGEMSELEFVTFLAASLRLLARYSTAGSVHFVCMDWRHMSELLNAGRQAWRSIVTIRKDRRRMFDDDISSHCTCA